MIESGNENKWLDEKQVGEMLNRSPQTLRKDRHYRRGLPYTKIGRLIRYSERDVVEYMNQRRVTFD